MKTFCRKWVSSNWVGRTKKEGVKWDSKKRGIIG